MIKILSLLSLLLIISQVAISQKEEQIKHLQRQVKELERERDILKKALSIFSRVT